MANIENKEVVNNNNEMVSNPYCYEDHEITVRIAFAKNGRTLSECLSEYINLESGIVTI